MLTLLHQSAEYTSNHQLLTMVLQRHGHGEATMDLVDEDLTWLSAQGLVKRETIVGITIARLTQRGEDVAMGRTGHPDIARPGP